MNVCIGPRRVWVSSALSTSRSPRLISLNPFTHWGFLDDRLGYPQGSVDAALVISPFFCSHSDLNDEGRPATNDDGPLAPNPLATRGAVVSMPAARPNTPVCPPDRTQLDDPLPLSVCVAEVAQLLLTRES